MEKPHIVLYGRVNAGKSTLFNHLLRQNLAVVSDLPGTTTDTVTKAIELQGVGAVLLIDTPGIEDESEIGALRMSATERALKEADLILYVHNPGEKLDPLLEERYPEASILPVLTKSEEIQMDGNYLSVNGLTGEGIDSLIQAIGVTLSKKVEHNSITGRLAKAGDLIVLVMPQDASAPKGRLILPQVQTIRELLDKDCQVLCTQTDQLTLALSRLASQPDLIITDSQAFSEVEQLIPDSVPLTSFSVLMSAYKGSLPELIEGARVIDTLSRNSRILIAEACSHTPTTEDIGTVKIPKLLRKRLGDQVQINHVNGKDFPNDLSDYDLVIHCGACMFNRQLLLNRQRQATTQQIPMTNYGIAIAQLLGILDRIALP